MAKAYRGILKYTYTKAKKVKERHIKTEQTQIHYKSPEDAEAAIQAMIDRHNSVDRNFKFIDKSIEEYDIPTETRYEGIVDYGNDPYEPVLRIGKNHIDTIVGNLETRKVEVIVKVLD